MDFLEIAGIDKAPRDDDIGAARRYQRRERSRVAANRHRFGKGGALVGRKDRLDSSSESAVGHPGVIGPVEGHTRGTTSGEIQDRPKYATAELHILVEYMAHVVFVGPDDVEVARRIVCGKRTKIENVGWISGNI